MKSQDIRKYKREKAPTRGAFIVWAVTVRPASAC